MSIFLYVLHGLLLCAVVVFPDPAYSLGVWGEPGNGWAITVQVGLGLLAWSTYYLPRRGESRSFSLNAVISLSATTLVFGLASYWTCSGAGAPVWTPLVQTLSLFIGNVEVPYGAVAGCPETIPLVFQLARIAALVLVGVGVAAALGLLFRGQLDRLVVRFSSSVVVLAGVDDSMVELVRRIHADTSPRTKIVLLEEGSMKSAQANNHRDVISLRVKASDARSLKPIVLKGGQLALRGVYLLSPDASANIAMLESFRRAVPGSALHRGFPPRAVVRIDDTWQAEYWRRENIDADRTWLLEAVSLIEVTARMIVDNIVRGKFDQVILTVDPLLTLAVLAELSQRRREQSVSLMAARSSLPKTTILGPTAYRLLELHNLRQRRFGNVTEEHRIDGREATAAVITDLAGDAENPVIVCLGSPGTAVQEPISVLAAERPDWTIYSWEGGAGAIQRHPVMERLYPFGLTWQSESYPIDNWDRIARIAHTNFVSKYPAQGAKPSHRPWEDGLSDFHRQSNVRLITTTLASAVAVGRDWGPFGEGERAAPTWMPSDGQLEEMARREHESWMEHHLANGWRYAAARDDNKRRHSLLLPWEKLTEENQSKSRAAVEDAIRLLAGLGYRSDERCSQGEFAVLHE